MEFIGEIISWTLNASSIIIFVFLIGVLFRKTVSRNYQCILWAIVLVRLLVPNMPISHFSIFNLLNSHQSIQLESSKKEDWVKVNQQPVQEIETLENTHWVQENIVPMSIHKESEDINKVEQGLMTQSIGDKLAYIWLIGVIGLAGYWIYGYLNFKKRINHLEDVEDKVILELFESCKARVHIGAKGKSIQLKKWHHSMIFGITKPVITIPCNYTLKELEVILLHELNHYKYKDHWMTYIHLIALSLHWFNPLVWFAVKQMKQDIEYACDERVIHLGVGKKHYANTIFRMIIPVRGDRVFGQAMGDTPRQAKSRIKKIAIVKKNKKIATFFSCILVAMMSVGCLTDAPSSQGGMLKGGKWKGIRNIAILGLDQDEIRTDSIMVAQINCDNGAIQFISIPRDTKVVLDKEQQASIDMTENKGAKIMKMNELYAYGGQEGLKPLLIKELEKLLELKIDNYVMINLKEAEKLVDALGGIDIEVPQDMYYQDREQGLLIDLRAGMQQLHGNQTLQLIRFRRYLDGDLGRVATTQITIKALLEKATTLSTVEEFTKVVKSISDTVDTDIPMINFVDYYEILERIDMEKVSFIILPGEAVYENGRSYYNVDKIKRAKLVNALH